MTNTIPSVDGFPEILYDVNANGREIDWRFHKLSSLKLAYSYKRQHNPKAARIFKCGNFLEFHRLADNSLKLRYANFCQTRLCPTCCWRRSRKIFAQVSKIISKLDSEGSYSYIFLTLTCKNAPADKLCEQIDELFAAYKALCLRKSFKSAVLGWFRSLEVTFNWEENAFHPHFHVILVVNDIYFSKSHDLYINQAQWTTLWQSCLGVDYRPIVDIRGLKNSRLGKEIMEVSKYVIKPMNIFPDMREIQRYHYEKEIQDAAKVFVENKTDELVAVLDLVLAHRRLIGYGGIFKEKHRELNLDDAEDGNLIHAGESEVHGSDYSSEIYQWDAKLRMHIKDES